MRHIRRFDTVDRITHVVLMFSFLGPALTGLPLLFNDARWASRLARILGGLQFAGRLHRFFAIVLIGVFSAHVGRLLHRLFIKKDYGILWGPESMVPQPRDLKEMSRHFAWFFNRGPKPRFDHFTYWEKFDYWAVFWGMGIIGASGLLLWFPVLFARVVPGWFFNIALLVHGEEALLAVGFIFTMHFFNGHLRPEKFPMDRVIFTGRVSLDELEEERPSEYARLKASGGLAALQVSPPEPWLTRLGTVIGTIAVAIGLLLVGFILYAVLT